MAKKPETPVTAKQFNEEVGRREVQTEANRWRPMMSGQKTSVDLKAFSTALRKLLDAAGTGRGHDCYGMASLAAAGLTRLNFTCAIHIGYAAWRVDGPCPHGVVSHHPGGTVAPMEKGLVFHCWIGHGGRLLDFSTGDLREKARVIDEADGLNTPVTWCPDFLDVDTTESRSYADVVNASEAGVFYYERQMDLERFVISKCGPAHESDVSALLIVYEAERRGGVRIIGPNSVGGVACV